MVISLSQRGDKPNQELADEIITSISANSVAENRKCFAGKRFDKALKYFE